jgi:hypothetical protein
MTHMFAAPTGPPAGSSPRLIHEARFSGLAVLARFSGLPDFSRRLEPAGVDWRGKITRCSMVVLGREGFNFPSSPPRRL